MRENASIVASLFNAWCHCWCGHVTLPHSCVIQVFIAVAWQQTRRGEAMRRDALLVRTRLGSARRKHRFVNCCVITGACFDVAVLAWRKYSTILMIPLYLKYLSFINKLISSFIIWGKITWKHNSCATNSLVHLHRTQQIIKKWKYVCHQGTETSLFGRFRTSPGTFSCWRPTSGSPVN
jgi:hypothetical protein